MSSGGGADDPGGEPPDNVVAFPGVEDGAPGGERPVDPSWVVAGVEALLFAAGEPVGVAELADALELTDVAPVREALATLAADRAAAGVRPVEVAGGWQLRTDSRFGEAAVRLRGGRPQTMSKAALEALAIVAYRQPVTRSEVDAVRGVNSGGVLKTLLDKGYLRVVGRREEPGRPLEYGTTPLFLEVFSLRSLDDLPTLAEREDLADVEDPTIPGPEGDEPG